MNNGMPAASGEPQTQPGPHHSRPMQVVGRITTSTAILCNHTRPSITTRMLLTGTPATALIVESSAEATYAQAAASARCVVRRVDV